MKLPFGLCLLAAAISAPCLSRETMPQTWKPLAMDSPPEMRAATPLGAKNGSDVLHISVGIALRDPAGLQRFVDDVSNPKSPNYRHFLSPEEVGVRFGVSSTSLKTAADYLTASGMKVRLVAKNRLSILADATVAQAEKAFHTHLQDFEVPVQGSHARAIRFAYTVPPSVPASLSRVVNYIGGLESFTHPIRRGTLTPDQLRTLYSVSNLYRNGFQGQGRTIAISNWDGYLLSNVPLEYSQFNLPSPSGGVGSNITVIPIDGDNGNTFPAQGEGDIDIQCALAMAPLCSLLIYDNAQADNQDLLGVLTQEADDNKADIISESYGWTPNTPLFESAHTIHLSMSAQGITYLAAAGDTGAQGIIGSPYPDEDPEVLVVGGTTVSVDGAGNRQSEVAWNNTGYAGGGGWTPNTDSMNVLPAYQKGNGVPTNIPYRLVPDIALDADPYTGYEIFYQGTFTPGYGGTSCASPTTAGSLADCEQQLIAAGFLTANAKGKYRMGRLQDLLYSYNGDPSVFFDVVSGDVGTLPDGTTASAGPGWDFASGWGAPIFAGLVNRILNIPTPTSFTLNPSEVTGGTSVTATVTTNLPAPTGGFQFTITSDTSQAAVPSKVTVPAGQKSTTFTIATSGSAQSVTANLTASATGITLTAQLIIDPSSVSGVSITPNAIVGGNYATGTVTLSGPAPTGGLDVALSSDNSSVMVPQHVEVPAGSNTGLFSVASSPVTASITATITASYNGASAAAGLSVSPPSFSGFTVSQSTVQGGTPSTGTVTMTNPAPAGGFTVTLSSDNAAATTPASATIPAGATTVSIKISTSAVSTSTYANITAANGATSYTATLTVTPAGLNSLSIKPSQVSGGNSASGSVTLSGAAGQGGALITLQSNVAGVTVPSAVTVPAGSTSATFAIQTITVSASASATITATYLGVNLTANLSVTPVVLSNVTISPSAVVGGSPSSGTVTLSGPAPTGGVSVLLRSNSVSASVPSVVSVPAGAAFANFSISTAAVTATVSVTISGTFNGTTQGAVLTVETPLLMSLTVSPNALVGGNSATGTVSLARPAPSGGVTVSLASNSVDVTVPATVGFAAGSSSAAFMVTTSGVAAAESDTVSASLNGTKLSATISLQPAAVAALSVSPPSVVGGTSATVTISLNGFAPSGGLVVPLTSSSTSASVPATATVPAGASMTSVPVQTKPVSTAVNATISTMVGSNPVGATLSVLPASLSGISVSSSTVVGGSTQILTGTVSLSGPLGGASSTVKLSSSDAKIIEVPASIPIASGAASVTFAIHHFKTAASQSVTLTATFGSEIQSVVIEVLPFEVASVSLSPVMTTGGAKAAGLVVLNAVPSSAAGPVRVNLASSNKSASVVLAVTVLPNTDSAKFTVTTVAVKSTTQALVTASIGVSSQSENLTINPPSLLNISVAPASVKGSSATAVTGTLTLSGPAPTGGVVVTLSSSVASASVPTTVVIPAGRTSAGFRVTHKAVTASVTAVITATLSGASASANLKLTP